MAKPQPDMAVPLRAAVVALPLLLLGAGGCLYLMDWHPPPEPREAIRTAPQPEGSAETYCAWYGDERNGVLYFGESAFWWAWRRHGHEPTADLLEPGPQRIGRFAVGALALLPPLEVGPASSRSGVWDVFAHPNGLVYFTTFFDLAGSVDPRTKRVVRFEAAGTGLNELAPGPDGSILVSRYASAGGGDGSLVLLEPDGRVRVEYPLAPVPGYRVAPKTVAWDPGRDVFWTTTDLLPRAAGAGAEPRHDARSLDRQGRELARIEDPEVQFVAFRGDGTGLFAEVDAGGLWLRIVAPDDRGAPLERGERILLDAAFPRDLDFVQDIQFADDGRAVAMRWSGHAHVVDPAGGPVRTVLLPALHEGGLYYTGVLRQGGVCATLCADLSVVCEAAAGL